MDINVVTDPDEIREIIPIIKSAWGMENLDQLVKDIVAAMRFHGGLVLLARDAGKVVGMHYSFPGHRNGKTYLYSHMTGVLHQEKYHGVGLSLKLAQQKWAKENGYELIAWTYDPLMSLNANFNFNKLGVFVRSYLENFYGSMEDSLNFGLPTDRFVAEWWVDSKRPEVRPPSFFVNSDSDLADLNLELKHETVGIRIPADFVVMKKGSPETAAKVRFSLRKAFETLFDAGFAAVAYNKQDSYYILVKNPRFVEKYGENIFKVR